MGKSNNLGPKGRPSTTAPEGIAQSFPLGELPGTPEARVAPTTPHWPETPEQPESPACPVGRESLGSPEHPVSEGRGLREDLFREKDLKGLAAHNACTARNTARTRRWQLVRDLKAVELRWGALDTSELMLAFDEWHRLSQPFLDSQKTRDDYLALFLAEFGKVRVPTGEGEILKKAVESVSRLRLDQLPEIPGLPNALESWAQTSSTSSRAISLVCESDIFPQLPRCR